MEHAARRYGRGGTSEPTRIPLGSRRAARESALRPVMDGLASVPPGDALPAAVTVPPDRGANSSGRSQEGAYEALPSDAHQREQRPGVELGHGVERDAPDAPARPEEQRDELPGRSLPDAPPPPRFTQPEEYLGFLLEAEDRQGLAAARQSDTKQARRTALVLGYQPVVARGALAPAVLDRSLDPDGDRLSIMRSSSRRVVSASQADGAGRFCRPAPSWPVAPSGSGARVTVGPGSRRLSRPPRALRPPPPPRCPRRRPCGCGLLPWPRGASRPRPLPR